MIGNCPNFILHTGETHQLTANLAPIDATDKTVIWSSSKPEVSSVDENGLVTAISQGSVKIIITTNDGAYKNTCNIGVMGTTAGADNFEIHNLVKIYPNPAPDKLFVEFSEMDMNREIIIYNSTGQLIYRENVHDLKKQINIKKLNGKGLLAVQIKSGKKYSVHKVCVL